MTSRDLEQRILPLFEFAPLETKEKFSLFAEKSKKHLGILGRGQLFSCFHRDHLQEATDFFEMLIGAETFNEFLDICHQARDFLNEGLYVYAVSVAILHRDDCKGITLPPIQEIFPDKFVNIETLSSASHKLLERAGSTSKDDIIVDWVTPFHHGQVHDPEFRLFYYREDIELNAHHWHWHLVYPATWNAAVTKKNKNRKGELFYYMHQQMCARYDCERLSNDLPRMVPFHNFHEPLDGYSSHLHSSINGLPYTSRPSGLTLKDLKEVSVQDLERWRDRILSGIHLGYVTKETGEEVALTETFGIDILGDLIESSHESVNADFYGSLHNWGHVMMAAIQDPKGKYQTNPGVMSDTATSLRDPIFYRWHRFLDNIFQEYKKTLHSYTKDHLGFTGIEINSVTVETDETHRLFDVHTNFVTSLLNISSAFPVGTDIPIKVRWPHLQHEAFTYKIHVINQAAKVRRATIRIFLAPIYDELGNKLNPNQLRRLMIELDKFEEDLNPGSNMIRRKSGDSSVTLSYETTFEQLLRGEAVSAKPNEYCSCGWPEHLLLPKGHEKGMEFHLFVMVTDFLDDVVGEAKTGTCVDAVSYCGAKDELYPDRRAMGFPFDRSIDAETLEEWLLPNMSDTIIKITHVSEEHHD